MGWNWWAWYEYVWCDPNKAYSLGQRLGPNHAQGPIHGLHASQSQSPPRGPITRGMLKKIQLGFIQDGPNPHGLVALFLWAKEITKTWRSASKPNKIDFKLGQCLDFAFNNGVRHKNRCYMYKWARPTKSLP